jgi:hypothetical protein
MSSAVSKTDYLVESVTVPKYLSVEECVDILGGHISRFRLYQVLKAGELRGFQPGGKAGRWLVRAEDLMAWVETGSRSPAEGQTARAPHGGKTGE